jgi:predicted GNAT family N-acyltransferase
VEIDFFDIFDQARMNEALSIRRQVFVIEQGVPESEEIDAHDREDGEAVHALARPEAHVNAVGAARLFARDSQTAQIGRMAVLAHARGCGVGRALLDALVSKAQQRLFVRVQLDAQVHALAFYESAGFVAAGEPMWEAGILHQPMCRRLAP